MTIVNEVDWKRLVDAGLLYKINVSNYKRETYFVVDLVVNSIVKAEFLIVNFSILISAMNLVSELVVKFDHFLKRIEG